MTQETYNVFKSADIRRELYQYCKRVTEYLHKHKVPSLVLLDRAARPLAAGVRECWINTYADQPVPHMYFVNPYGFKTAKDLTKVDILKQIVPGITGEDPPPLPDATRTQEDIQKEFVKSYPQLLHDKSKPVLLFDSCIHSGGTLLPVKNILRQLGFTDVRVGAVEDAPSSASMSLDLFMREEGDQPAGECHPFGHDKLVKKTYNKVHSDRNTDPTAIIRAKQLREEIKHIVRNKGRT